MMAELNLHVWKEESIWQSFAEGEQQGRGFASVSSACGSSGASGWPSWEAMY